MKMTNQQLRARTQVKSGVVDRHFQELCDKCHAKCQTKPSDSQAQCHKVCEGTLPKCNAKP